MEALFRNFAAIIAHRPSSRIQYFFWKVRFMHILKDQLRVEIKAFIVALTDEK